MKTKRVRKTGGAAGGPESASNAASGGMAEADVTPTGRSMDGSSARGRTFSTRWLLLVSTIALALAGASWLRFGLPAQRRASVRSATARQVLQLGEARLTDIPIVSLVAQRLLDLRRFADATSLLTASLARNAQAAPADKALLKGSLAEAEILTGRTTAGTADADSALELDPNCRPASVALAIWSERQAQWSDAQSQFDLAERNEPGDNLIRYHLTRVLMHEGQFVQAANVSRTLALQHPDSYEDRVLCAVSEAYLGHFGDAAREFGQAALLHPRSWEAHANVVRARAFAARTESECRDQELPVSRLLNGDPDAAIDQEILGMLELHAGDTVAAQIHLEAAARAYVSRPLQLGAPGLEIFRNLKIVHILNGQEAASLRDAREAQNFLEPLFNLQTLDEAVTEGSQDPEVHSRLAALYDRLGAAGEAINEYEAMLRLHADEMEASSRIDSISSRPDLPESETGWAWNVLSTQSGLLLPSKQTAPISG